MAFLCPRYQSVMHWLCWRMTVSTPIISFIISPTPFSYLYTICDFWTDSPFLPRLSLLYLYDITSTDTLSHYHYYDWGWVLFIPGVCYNYSPLEFVTGLWSHVGRRVWVGQVWVWVRCESSAQNLYPCPRFGGFCFNMTRRGKLPSHIKMGVQCNKKGETPSLAHQNGCLTWQGGETPSLLCRQIWRTRLGGVFFVSSVREWGEEAAEHWNHAHMGMFSMFGVRGMVVDLQNMKTCPWGCVFMFGVRGSWRGMAGGQMRGVSGSRRWGEVGVD